MNDIDEFNAKVKQPPKHKEYIGYLYFGWAYSIFINIAIVGSKFSIFSISEGLGGGLLFLLVGWTLSVWRGTRSGWIAVFVLAFFIFIGASPQ